MSAGTIYNLGVFQIITIESILWATAMLPGPRLLSFDTLALEISLGFQSEKQFVVGSYSSLDSGLLTTDVKVSKSCHSSKTKT